MKKNNPQQKLLRIEHEWLELHVRAYLKDGLAYTIRLMDGAEIREAVFHFDAVFEKHHFFKVGVNCTYPIRDVYCHSIEGHPVPPAPEPAPLKPDPDPDPDRLVVTDKVDEVINVATTPDENPDTFRRRVKCLMISGMTQAEAEKYAIDHPMQLSLFYDIGRGGFAVDAVFIDQATPYNPFTGQEIPKEED